MNQQEAQALDAAAVQAYDLLNTSKGPHHRDVVSRRDQTIRGFLIEKTDQVLAVHNGLGELNDPRSLKKERHDHIRKDDHVPQGQNWNH